MNAVKTQTWAAVTVYVLVAIIKKRLDLNHSLYTLLQIFSVTLFEKTLSIQGFVDAVHTPEGRPDDKQLNFDWN